MAAKIQKPLNELLTNNMVDIYVGPKRKHWCLHKDLLSDRSPFLLTTFSSGVKEEHGNGMYLPDDDPDAFELFVNWLYGARLVPIRYFFHHKLVEKDVITLCKLHVLASKLCIEPLMNLVIDDIRRYNRLWGTHTSNIVRQYISANAVAPSPLLHYIAHEIAYELSGDPEKYCSYEKLLRGNNELSSIILCITFASGKERVLLDPAREGICLFHKHKGRKSCGAWR
ncbi:MAG: hypothetical protein M1812_006924 [Candelaria pacifica]|nr:MAG: hypothetical protein M1812_006924 [Candelaria pacifica]